MFEHIVRLAEELQPPFIFMENVPGIVGAGLERVLHDIGERLRYELRWCMCTAEQVGAPHMRRRWFCLAIRSPADSERLAAYVNDLPLVEPYQWKGSVVPSRTIDDSRARRMRCAALGNAVVPDALRAAFIALAQFQPVRTPSRYSRKRLPTNGYRLTDGIVGVWRPKLPRASPWNHLCFRAEVFEPDPGRPNGKRIHPILTDPVPAVRWTTPRHGVVYACNVLTKRSLRDLPSQVRFEVDTGDPDRRRQINPEFVEYMMGYPIQWTDCVTP